MGPHHRMGMGEMRPSIRLIPLGLGLVWLMAACASNFSGEDRSPGPGMADESEREPLANERDYRIVTLLPRDAIPAIDNPVFHSVTEADEEYLPDERVLGVFFNGEARAYSVNLLSGHEIVNDEIDGVKFAVTW